MKAAFLKSNPLIEIPKSNKEYKMQKNSINAYYNHDGSLNNYPNQCDFFRLVSKKLDVGSLECIGEFYAKSNIKNKGLARGFKPDDHAYCSFNLTNYKLVLQVPTTPAGGSIRIGIIKINPNDKSERLDISQKDINIIQQSFPNAIEEVWQNTRFMILQTSVSSEKWNEIESLEALANYLVTHLHRAFLVMKSLEQ